MSSPAGIGIRNTDGTIQFIIISDKGWIKDGIGDWLFREYQTEKLVRQLIEERLLPQGYFVQPGTALQKAEAEFLFMRYCFFQPRCYILYTYIWKGEWFFRRLDGSGDIPLRQAILQGIED